jgi:arylsulfatase A
MTQEAKPNVVLILVDDMGYGDFGALNYGRSRTPVLDELMREGVLLTQHYSASPICAPARAALMTGRYPHRTGAIETRELRGLCNMALRETTIGDLFKRAGYATGLIGKWHSGGVRPEFHPNRRGFDDFAGFRSAWQDYYRWTLDRNGSFEKADGRYLTDVLTEEAVAFIKRHRREPFLLNVCYNAPHTPLQAPAEAVRPFAETGAYTTAVSTLYGMIGIMDAGVGRMLEALQQLGLAENTIVMFTSDNGPQFGGRGEACTTRFNCGFNGSKSFVYEGGIRVPMILRWPAGLAGKRHVHEMVHFCDWLPTLLAATGVEAQMELPLDGCNVLPVLQGEPRDVPTRRFWQWNRYQPEVTSNAAMRDGDWKLVRPAIRETFWTDPEEQKLDSAYRDEPWGDVEVITGGFPARTLPEPSPPELYNIAADPLERRDLAPEYPALAARMLRDLEQWFEDVEADRASAGGPW